MLSGGIPIGKAFGIPLRLHYSWFIIFTLVTWALAGSYFPDTYPTWSSAAAIAAGVITSLLFFGSVLAHELMHSVVAQREGIPVQSITLFIFGGVSQLTAEPKRPDDEFRMAIVGPGTSLVLGGVFWAIYFGLHHTTGATQFIGAIAYWLGLINLSLGVFNLIPGFPLDGGRVLRSILWGRSHNLLKATKTASDIGRGTGYLFIFVGIWFLFTTQWLNGIWLAFIGWFLESAAAGSYRQLALQDRLQGHKASEIMTQDCSKIDPDITIEQLVNEHILSSGRRCFTVVADAHVVGLVTMHNIKVVPRDLWKTKRVKEAMTTLDKVKSVGPNEELLTVLRIMNENDINQVPVMEDHNLIGMIGRDNILSFLDIHKDLST
jgi:Zn-dependent protease/predicted transcriptional regulator